MLKTYIFAIFSGLFLLMSCQQKGSNSFIQNGDILFRGNNQSGLSEAINEVTQTKKGTDYTHMGICTIENNTVWVIHASPENGVTKEPLEIFCNPNNESGYSTDVYRINKKLTLHIPNAIKRANKLIGNPYDSTYILESKGYYCSEFIYDIFKEDSIFSVNPMTFKDPKTNEFHQGWVEHYQQLGINIPEGKLGCNPNEMSSNSKLLFIKRL